MTAAETIPNGRRLPIRYLLLGVLAVPLVVVALVGRDPEPVPMPVMATQPVSMPDGRNFYAQRFELTISEWNACAADGGCERELRARPDQNELDTPATGLNYLDALQYVDWIQRSTGHDFRLPTAEEWNVMAADVMPDEPDPIFTDPSLSWASSYLVEGLASRALKPQGSFSISQEGVGDLDGSVWEWTSECYDGLSRGTNPDRCPAFFVGGEHIAAMSLLVRDPMRGGCAVGTPPAHLGMRLVSDHPVQN